MSARKTAHPTGDHWVAPRDRALFGTPPPLQEAADELLIDLTDDVVATIDIADFADQAERRERLRAEGMRWLHELTVGDQRMARAS